MENRRVHLRIHGLVQGVSYRACARDEALLLGLRGWVRNLPNGDVEAIVSGAPQAVDRFIAWCRQGPAEAAVDSVAVTEDSSSQAFSTFLVLR